MTQTCGDALTAPIAAHSPYGGVKHHYLPKGQTGYLHTSQCIQRPPCPILQALPGLSSRLQAPGAVQDQRPSHCGSYRRRGCRSAQEVLFKKIHKRVYGLVGGRIARIAPVARPSQNWPPIKMLPFLSCRRTGPTAACAEAGDLLVRMQP